MEKRSFRLLFIIAAVFAVCILSCITANAAGTAEFYIPDGAVPAGEEFEVSIVFSGDKNIGWVDTNLTYDDSAVQFISGDGANGGGGILTIKDFPDSQSSEVKVTLRFKALKKGSSEMHISNCAIFADDSSLIGSPTAYASVTAGEPSETTVTTLPPESPDESSAESTSETTSTSVVTTVETGADGFPVKGVLKELTVSAGELVPAFSPDIYNYTVKVDNSVDYCEIDGTTASVTDYIWFEGSNNLQVGDNVRSITVTDDNGNKKTYTIIIQRSEQASVESQADSEEPQATVTSVTKASKESVKIIDDEESAFDQYKKIIMPALWIVMFVLVLALVIIVVWLRKKSQERKSESNKKSSAKKRK